MRLTLFFLFFTTFVFGQQLQTVDFKQADVELEVFFDEKKVKGTVNYSFEILKSIDTVFLNAVNMKIELAETSAKGLELISTSDKILFVYPFQSGEIYEAGIHFEASPQQTVYFFEDQLWTQGQGRETSHWLPSINDVNDKIIFNFSVTAPSDLLVLANGKLKETSPVSDTKTRWDYAMQHPMSSYLAALAVGKFIKNVETSTSGIPLEYYLPKGEEDKMEPTFRYTKKIIDFFEQETGVAYPWEVYKQVAVRDFLHAGMENTTLTIFSKAFVVDSIGFNDRNYVNVNAHEIAHQWFGNLVTAENNEHHWLQEGFATYYALLAEREIFGDDYFYWKLYQSAEQLTELSDQGKGEPLVKTGGSSLTYYQKGAWALHILREQIGELAFKQAVINFLAKHSFSSANTDDFLIEIELLTGDKLQWFKDDWLYQGAFRSSQAIESLRKSPFIENYLGLKAISNTPFSQKENLLSGFLNPPVNDYLGQEVVYQLVDVPKSESISLYKKAFQSNKLFVRQAIAISLEQIPQELKSAYETLLDDFSYVTREAALYHLWINFPEDRHKYLDKMQKETGFQDKNIRQLWLTLAIVTEAYKNELKPSFFDELSSYASPKYSFEIRQNAFQYLYGLNGFAYQNLKHLIDACLHPNWRFRRSSRELFDLLLEDTETKLLVKYLLNELTENQIEWIKTRLGN